MECNVDYPLLMNVYSRSSRFRWVDCQLDALKKCRSPTTLQKALKNLPKTLYGTYDRILAAISEDDRQDALNLLQWLAFSVRTISLDEAVEVLATDPDAVGVPLFDPYRGLRDPRDILTICSSLVSITPVVLLGYTESNGGDQSYDEERNLLRTVRNTTRFPHMATVKLAHFSVGEYLTSDYFREGNTGILFYHFDKEIANTFIAKTCVAYLLQFDTYCVTHDTEKTYPLFDYAAQHWTHHAQSDGDGRSETLHRLIMQLLNPSDPMYTNWLVHAKKSIKPSPLYYSLLAGLKRVSLALLSTGSNVNMQGGAFGTPLQIASFKGYTSIVQSLLEHGADVNASEGPYGNALLGATFGGHDDIIQFLLEHGADANAQEEGFGWTPLSAASLRGANAIVQSLMDHGADVNTQGGHYGTTLQAASSKGHESIVILLLKHRADVNAHGGIEGSALLAALSGGHDTIVQLLLEHGSDVNTQGGSHGNALCEASFKGQYAIVQLLLEHGADVDAHGGPHGSAHRRRLQGLTLTSSDCCWRGERT